MKSLHDNLVNAVWLAALCCVVALFCGGCAEMLNTLPEASGNRTCPYCGAYYPSASDYRNHVPNCSARR